MLGIKEYLNTNIIQQDHLKADDSASKLTNTLNDDTGINVIDNYNE